MSRGRYFVTIRGRYLVIGKRRYYDPIHAVCEHCDGERHDYIRHDDLRGTICPYCDSSIDEMFKETA